MARTVRTVEKFRERLRRAARALESASVAYAVVDGNAVAAWVTTVDEAAVRNTRDVDVLLRRGDLERAIKAIADAGLDLFLDGENTGALDAVPIVFANELVREHELLPNPDVTDSHDTGQFRILSLDALVRIKLTAFRDKDRTHLRDMLEVGLIDATWVKGLPPELAVRLQSLIDDPNG